MPTRPAGARTALAGPALRRIARISLFGLREFVGRTDRVRSGARREEGASRSSSFRPTPSLALNACLQESSCCAHFLRGVFSSSPRDAGVGRGPRRGAAPPLPSPSSPPSDGGTCLGVAVVALRQHRRVQRRNDGCRRLAWGKNLAPLYAALLVAARRVPPPHYRYARGRSNNSRNSRTGRVVGNESGAVNGPAPARTNQKKRPCRFQRTPTRSFAGGELWSWQVRRFPSGRCMGWNWAGIARTKLAQTQRRCKPKPSVRQKENQPA